MKLATCIVGSLLAMALGAAPSLAQTRGPVGPQGQGQGQGQQGGFGQGGQGGGQQGPFGQAAQGGGQQGGFGQGGPGGGPGGAQQGGGPGGGGPGGFGQQGGFGGRGGMGGFGGFGNFGGITDPTNEMIRTLTDLTEDQKNQLRAKVTAGNQALTDMRTAEGQKMQELWQGGDQQAIQDEVATFQKDTAELQTKTAAELDAVLTPDQKNAWQGYLLAKLIKTRLASAVLAKEQIDKIEEMAKAAGKDITAAKDVDAKNTIYGGVFKKVVETVVTQEQAGKIVSGTIVRPGG